MKIEKIKPIPKYIQKKIKLYDDQLKTAPFGRTRFYAYFTKNDGELVKVTVAVREYKKQWYCKPVVVHGIHSDRCFGKDIKFTFIAGYSVGWHEQGISKYPDWYESKEWGWASDDSFDPYAPIVNRDYILQHFPEYKCVMLRVVKILNVLMIELPFAACWFLYYSHQTYANLEWKGHFAILGLFFILYIVLGKIYDAFWMSMQRVSELVYGQILGAMATDGILYIVICLMSAKLCNLLPGIAAIVGQLVMAAIWASCAHKWYYTTFPPQKTAVVYDVRHGMEKLINEYGLNQKYDVQVTLSVSECLADLSILDGMETVFVSGVHSHERNIILKHCVGKGINMFVIPRVGDVIMSGAWPMHMFHLPMLRVGRYMASPEFLFIKRAMDIVISLLALVILSPLFLITAIAVKSDGGPTFYKQVRLTKDGKQFEILKFRSMRVDAEKDGVARLSTGDKDDRITKVGHIIRACRLDELPQLLNILKGDLSVVGPRPERPEIAAQYCEEMPEFALRLQAKAGLTGYAQVYGKYNTTPYDKLQMDLMYIAHPSLIEDLKIMLATVKILFMPESTEGVAEGATTAMGQETK